MSGLERILHEFGDFCQTGGDEGIDIREAMTKINTLHKSEREKWALGLLPKELRKDTYQSTTKYENGYNQCRAETLDKIEGKNDKERLRLGS